MAEEKKRILAIGGHAGDMEVSCGSVLAKHARLGDSVTLLHLTLGEGGNPKMSPARYAEQKRSEASSIGVRIGAEVFFGPFKDGELMNTVEHQRYVADVIRQVKPTHIITHWKNSIHKDHAQTHGIVLDAILLASLEGVVTQHPRYRGVRAIYYTENWEDPEGFTPTVLVNVTEDLEAWKEWIVTYEFVRGGISSFRYLDYYAALAVTRGALAGMRYAVSFDIDPIQKERRVDLLP